jgi:serine-type D-Ala-D-Ala carboxypeptidase/endopeptidase (penicillin-binding protein 4)
MSMLRRLLPSTLLSTLLAASGAAHAQLPEPVAQLLEAARIPQEAMGAVVLRNGAPLLMHGAERSMQPASTMKVLTTMAALEQLGPIFRGRTEMRTSAELVRGVLRGDLYLRGGADADFNEDVLTRMLQELRNQGIWRIQGNIVLDRQLFQPAQPDPHAPPFDEYPYAYYNVVPDALLLNTNLLRLELRATGSQLAAVMLPAMDKVALKADLKLVDAPCAQWETGWKPPEAVRTDGKINVLLRGTFPRDCSTSTSINVLDRHDYLERLLRITWKRLGGVLNGDVREADAAGATPPTARQLAAHVSRPLPELLRDINKQSDNTLARTLYLSLGSLEADSALGSHPLPPATDSTAVRAEQRIRAWLQERGIATEGLVLENGSGLSRLERVTPAQLAAVLQAGQRSLWMPEFVSSLPIAGLDGTMRKRLKDSPATLHARLKTGSLRGVVAIAGYVPDAGGQPCVVVAFINDEHVANGAGRAVLDALVDWVARAPQAPALPAR